MITCFGKAPNMSWDRRTLWDLSRGLGVRSLHVAARQLPVSGRPRDVHRSSVDLRWGYLISVQLQSEWWAVCAEGKAARDLNAHLAFSNNMFCFVAAMAAFYPTMEDYRSCLFAHRFLDSYCKDKCARRSPKPDLLIVDHRSLIRGLAVGGASAVETHPCSRCLGFVRPYLGGNTRQRCLDGEICWMRLWLTFLGFGVSLKVFVWCFDLLKVSFRDVRFWSVFCSKSLFKHNLKRPYHLGPYTASWRVQVL